MYIDHLKRCEKDWNISKYRVRKYRLRHHCFPQCYGVDPYILYRIQKIHILNVLNDTQS